MIWRRARGEYSFPLVPAGSYSIRAEQGGCTAAQTQSLVVDAVKTLNFALSDVTDAFGYHCRHEASAFIDANTVVALTGDDAAAPVALPFPFPFYGQQHSTAFVSTNGFLNFLASSSALANGDIPSFAAPNAAIYPFWDDLVVDGSASVRTELLGTAPDRRFVVEWRNVTFFGEPTRRLRFEVVLYENGQILTQYADVDSDAREQGNSATLGIENQSGTVALEYSNGLSSIESPSFAIRYIGPNNPPDTTITSQPANPTTSITASFSFTGSDDLSPPSQTFRVRAIDGEGVTDPTPAAYTWEIHAGTSLLYNGAQIVNVGGSLQAAAKLSSAAATCVGGQPISFSLDRNPLTGAPGRYPLGTASTNTSGQATGSMTLALRTAGIRATSR